MRRHPRLVLLALALAAAPLVPSHRAAAATDPCTIVTPADVQAVFGFSAAPLTLGSGDLVRCAYNKPDGSMVITALAKSDLKSAADVRSFTGGTMTERPGVGVIAFESVGRQSDLVVLGQRGAFELLLNTGTRNIPVPKAEHELLVALAKRVAGGSSASSASTSIPQSPPTGQPYRDDFSSGRGWTVFDNERGAAAYVPRNGNAALQITARAGWTTGTTFEAHTFADVEITARATVVSGKGGAAFGLICRASRLGNRYEALVSSTGKYLIRSVHGSEVTALTKAKDWTRAPRLAGTLTGATVGLRCQRQTIVLSVNGRVLESVRDTSVGAGEVGLVVDPPAEAAAVVSFDDVVIRDLTVR